MTKIESIPGWMPSFTFDSEVFLGGDKETKERAKNRHGVVWEVRVLKESDYKKLVRLARKGMG